VLRWFLHRFERHDPADAGPGPRFGHGTAGRRFRRARRRGEIHAAPGHQGLPGGEQVRRHLRPGPQRPPRFRSMAQGRRHPVDVPEPRYGGGYLATSGQAGLKLLGLPSGKLAGVNKPGAFGAPGFFVRGGWVRCVIPGGSQAPAIGFSAGWCLTPWRESDTWTWAAWKCAAWKWAAWKWAAAGV